MLNEWGEIPSYYVRVAQPLNASGLAWRAFPSLESPDDLAEVLRAPVLLVQRCMGEPFLDAARQAKSRGARVIYEIDDNLLDLPKRSLFVMKPEQKANIRALLQLADVVSVSTATLKQAFSAYSSDIRVVLNYGLDKPRASVVGRPHVGLVNTDYFKLASAKPFFAALEAAIVHLGYAVTFFGSVDAGMESLRSRWPGVVTVVRSFQPDRSAFLDQLAGSGVNVGIVPLDRDADHLFKSDIKFTDFASLGVAAIYNNPEVYAQVRHGVDGFFCDDDQRGWYQGLQFFSSESARLVTGGLARDTVRRRRSLQGYADALKAVILDDASRHAHAAMA